MTALVQELEFMRTVVIFLLLVNGGLSWMLWFRAVSSQERGK